MDNTNKIVFILDASDRNSGDFESMVISVKRLIEDISDNTFVAIVMFDNKTQISQKLVQITSETIRQNVLDTFTVDPETSGIDIESGLRAGLNVIDESGQSRGSTTLVLMVRHKDRSGQYIDDMLPELNKHQVILCPSFLTSHL